MNLMKSKKFPWPHHVDEESKTVYTYVESGYPTVMAVPIKVKESFPGYTSQLVSAEYLAELKKNL